jgi:hypothetical protein
MSEKENMMLPDTLPQAQSQYDTWYAFKRDLESLAGRFLPVDWWLRAKPKKPLPWTNQDMQDSLTVVIKIKQEPRYN